MFLHMPYNNCFPDMPTVPKRDDKGTFIHLFMHMFFDKVSLIG